MSEYKVFDDSGLIALFDQIKANRDTAAGNSAAISDLGEDLAGLSQEVVVALEKKQDTLTFDSTPTEGSENPVTSDGIATVISDVQSSITDLETRTSDIVKTVNNTAPDENGNVVVDIPEIPDTYSKIEIDAALAMKDIIVPANSTDGKVYTATIEGMDSLVVGVEFMIVPDTNSTVVNPTLNVNGLGAKMLRCSVSTNNATTAAATNANWLYATKPVKVRWNGTFWVTDIVRVDASTLFNNVPVEKGGTGASDAATARTNLGFTEEEWTFTLEDDSTVTKKVVIVS